MYLSTNKGKNMSKITIRLMIPILQIQILLPTMSTNFTQNWKEHCTFMGTFMGLFMDTGPGFAVLFPFQHFQFQLPSVSSVLMTELYAILFALRKLLSYSSSSFVIFSVSQNSLSLLCSLYTIHPLVCAIEEWLFCLYACKSLFIFVGF